MSITETTPADDDATVTEEAPVRAPAAVDWITSADHKRIGVAYLWTALLFAAVSGVAVVGLRLELVDGGIELLEDGADAQWQTLLYSASFFLFLLPAFLGLATYLVPLQIGARRLVFPRLHSLAYWLWLGGGGMVVASYLVEGGPYSAQALLVRPGAAQGGQASDLWLLGMGAVAVASVMAAVGLISTITTLRAPGMTLQRVPPFTWASLVGSTVVALAVPVFVAGLVLHGVNLNSGGRLWASEGMGNVWQHTLWIAMRPELVVTLVFAAGIACEVVATFARNRLPAYVPALGLLAASGALSFAVWASEKIGPEAPLAPTFSVPAVLPYLPLGLLILMWLATIATGRPRPSAALLFVVGMVLVLGAALVGGVSGMIVDVEGGTAWMEGHTALLLFFAPVFGLSAGIYYWAPKIWGRFLNEPLGYLQFLALLVGVLVANVPYYAGLRDTARFAVDVSGDELTWGRIVAAGDALVVVALGLLFLNVLGAALGKGRVATADAWQDGSTLEWLAPSPPPPTNFTDDIPPIRSEQPVADLRTPDEAVA